MFIIMIYLANTHCYNIYEQGLILVENKFILPLISIGVIVWGDTSPISEDKLVILVHT